jgi:hypothetical protein
MHVHGARVAIVTNTGEGGSCDAGGARVASARRPRRGPRARARELLTLLDARAH